MIRIEDQKNILDNIKTLVGNTEIFLRFTENSVSISIKDGDMRYSKSRLTEYEKNLIKNIAGELKKYASIKKVINYTYAISLRADGDEIRKIAKIINPIAINTRNVKGISEYLLKIDNNVEQFLKIKPQRVAGKNNLRF